MLIKKYFWAIIKKFKALIIAMIALGALSSTLFIGFTNAISNFKETYSTYVTDYGYPDITMSVDDFSNEKLNEIKNIEGVNKVEKRIQFVTNCLVNDRLVTLEIFSYDTDAIGKRYVHEWVKSYTNYGNLELEFKFAENNNVHLKDVIKIAYKDFAPVDVKVSKIVQAPETTLMRFGEVLKCDYVDFGCAYMPYDQLKEGLKQYYSISDDKYWNQILIDVKDGYDNEEVMNKVHNLLVDKNFDVLEQYTKESSESIKISLDYIGTIELCSIVLPLMFFTISLIINALFFLLIVRTQSRDVGSFLLIGCSKKQINRFFLFVNIVVNLIGYILGFFLALGSSEIIRAILMYDHFIPFIIRRIDWIIPLIGLGATAVSVGIIYLISRISLKKMTPKEAMYEAEKKQSRLLVRSKKQVSKISNDLQLAYSSIISNKKRTVSTFFSFFATYFIVFICVAFSFSMSGMMDQVINERLNYDAQVVLTETNNKSLVLENQDKFTNKSEVSYIASVTISKGDKEYKTSINTLEENHEYSIIRDKKHKIVPYYEDGIVLEETTAKWIGARVGDIVKVNGTDLEVKNIYEAYAIKNQVISEKVLDQLDVTFYKTFMLKYTDKALLEQYLLSYDFNGYVFLCESYIYTLQDEVNIYWTLAAVLIAFAIAIGIVIISLMTSSKYVDQKRRISILRLQGFKTKDISKIWFVEFGLIFLASLLFAVPAGIFGIKALLGAMSKEMFTYPFVASPICFLSSIGLIVISYLVIHFVLLKKVRLLNIAANTKSKE